MAITKNDPAELIFLKLLSKYKSLPIYFSIFWMIVDTCLFIYSIYGCYNLIVQYKFKNYVIIALGFLSQLSLLIQNLLSLKAVIRSSTLEQIYSFAFQNSLGSYKKHDRMNKISQFMRITLVMVMLVNLYYSIQAFGLDIYQYFIGRDFWFYTLNFYVTCGINIFNRNKESFMMINDKLEQLRDTLILPPYSTTKQMEVDRILMNFQVLKSLNGLFNKVCDLVDDFTYESKFGLAAMVICFIVNMLYCVSVILELSLRPVVLNGIDITPRLILWHLFLLLCCFGQAAVAAYAGESLQEEGERTSRICYNLLNHLGSNTMFQSNSLIVKELKFLLDQSTSRKIAIHAGGFFRINYAIVGSIMSTVVTYTIVIIQFSR